jgi:hypothetical protein
LFEELFAQIVRQCLEVGLVQGRHLSVDGSFVEANAAKESRIPREQLAEAAQVHQTVRQYLVELEQQNPTEEPVHSPNTIAISVPPARCSIMEGAFIGTMPSTTSDPQKMWPVLASTTMHQCCLPGPDHPPE